MDLLPLSYTPPPPPSSSSRGRQRPATSSGLSAVVALASVATLLVLAPILIAAAAVAAGAERLVLVMLDGLRCRRRIEQLFGREEHFLFAWAQFLDMTTSIGWVSRTSRTSSTC